MTIGHWYIGSCSSESYEPIVVVPFAVQKNGAFAAVFYEFWRRTADLGSTRYLNLLDLQETDPTAIKDRFRKEGDKCVDRINSKLPKQETRQ